MSEPDAWDDEDFEPEIPVVAKDVPEEWEGEDEDDDAKESGEDGDNLTGTAIQVKKKKSLKDRIAEKEAAKKAELEKKRLEVEASKKMTAEDRIADKLRRQKLQEEADLKIACDAFGVAPTAQVPRVDTFTPTSKEDFNTYGALIKDKVTQFEHSAHYLGFLENLYRDLAVSLEPEDLKKLGSALNTLANEKAKVQKGTKGKKKKVAPKLQAGKGGLEDYGADAGEDFGPGEYDDFI